MENLFKIIPKIHVETYIIKVDKQLAQTIINCSLKKIEQNKDVDDNLVKVFLAALVQVLIKLEAKKDSSKKIVKLTLTSVEHYAIRELIDIVEIEEDPLLQALLYQF